MHPCGTALLMNYHHVLSTIMKYSEHLLEQIYLWSFYVNCFLYLDLCSCLLCIVICRHSFHSTHIILFIVYNSVLCTKPFNILFYNGHIVLNYTAHFVYNPLNSYVYIHWILDFKLYIIIIIIN